MRLGRRILLLGGIASGLLAARGAGFGDQGIVRRTLAIIDEVFGPNVAAHPEALKFAQAYQEFVRDKGLEGIGLDISYKFYLEKLPFAQAADQKIRESIIEKFATSTNIIIAYETGAPLEFVALFHPYQASCASQLSPYAL